MFPRSWPGRPVKRALATLTLRLTGWKDTGIEPPADGKYVLIAAPHTSNWDLFFMLVFAAAHDVQLSWLGKHTLFSGLQGRLLRVLGGVPIDRRTKNNVVEQLAEEFASRDRLSLAIPPEGTRSYRDHWKSGFFYIAEAANVPIVLTFLDYGTKQGGFGPALDPSLGPDAVMQQIRDFYKGMRGRIPGRFGRPYLSVEASEPSDWPAEGPPSRPKGPSSPKE